MTSPVRLFDVLSPFARHGISMNRIESRPSHHGKVGIRLFIDLAAHRRRADAAALAELEAHSAQIKGAGLLPGGRALSAAVAALAAAPDASPRGVYGTIER